MHPKRCCQQLSKLLWFLTQGDSFGGMEAEQVFFGVTKLFQSPDGNLRRLVYLFLRAVAESTDASSLIIVTQSLVKDTVMNDVALFKGNAVRVLASIVDVSMLSQLERYFKQVSRRGRKGGGEGHVAAEPVACPPSCPLRFPITLCLPLGSALPPPFPPLCR